MPEYARESQTVSHLDGVGSLCLSSSSRLACFALLSLSLAVLRCFAWVALLDVTLHGLLRVAWHCSFA